MATADSFKSLDGVFRMFTPADLVGKQQPNLGGPLDKLDNVFSQILAIIENTGRGVPTVDDIKARLQGLKGKAQDGSSVDLSQFLAMYTMNEVVDLGPNTEGAKIYVKTDGTQETLVSLGEVIGKDFMAITPVSSAPFKASVIMSKSPFFSPAMRNTSKAEIFLNSMPSTVLSQLVPFLQVEFQVNRDMAPDHKLQALSQLKLLLGAVDKTTLGGANAAMQQGHQINPNGQQPGPEYNTVGMEVFTSPITLTNPQPNKNVGTNGVRYVDVLDPFRPFASIEHLVINGVPSGAGMFCYKDAVLTLKVHDRSRLNEISDLIRPRVYTGVTMWLTYGWRAPVRSDQNPYFSYVNDNLLVREAYHIKNSSYSFDTLGQVTITLQLYTKGIVELQSMKVTDNNQSMEFVSGEVRRLVDKISTWRKAHGLDKREGLLKDIRVYQIMDSGALGEMPPLDTDKIQENIEQLSKTLDKNGMLDSNAKNNLIEPLRQLYRPAGGNDKRKTDFGKRYEGRIGSIVDGMFLEVQTGPDPFLPCEGKEKIVEPELIKLCKEADPPAKTVVKQFRKNVVSFGKLFSVFALRAIMSMPEVVDEVQVFFYQMNDQCGPVSNCSVAEFPIDMKQFRDQYVHHVTSKGGESVLLEDFLALAIDGQFLDNRAIGYGFRKYYKDYKDGEEAQTDKNLEGQFESAKAAQLKKYGGFSKPAIQIYIECCHQRVSETGDNDALQQLSYSSSTTSSTSFKDAQGLASKRIMRIHIYDKNRSGSREAGMLLRSSDGHHFISTTQSTSDFQRTHQSNTQTIIASGNAATGARIAQDCESGLLQQDDDYATNQQIKDVVSKLIPTIRFGCNGTTVTTANLASKADPLLSGMQIHRADSVVNRATPNGSGELGIPLNVIPAQMTMTSLGNPLASMAQVYFVDFQTGTTCDGKYIVTGLTHTLAPGKFDTQWTFAFADCYGHFDGAPNINDEINSLMTPVPKDSSNG